MSNNKKFNKIRDIFLIVLLFIFLFFIMTFNFVVDPYCVFNKFCIKGFNNIKIHKLTSKRSIIYPDIKINSKGKDTAFVGNCLFYDYGMGLNNVIFSTIPMVKIEEVKDIISAIHKIAPDIKTIYLGIAFDEIWNKKNEEITDFLPELESEKINYKDLVTLLFSWNTTKYSIETVKASMRDKGEETAYIYPYREIAKKKYDTIFDLEEINKIKDIYDYTNANGMDLILYYPPIHVSKKVHVYEKGQWNNNLFLKRKLAEIVPFYDYSLFNEYNHFPLDENSQYFVDNLHSTKLFNNIVLKDILSENKKIGVLLNKDNIEKYLSEDTKNLEEYIKNNPKIVEKIKHAAPKYAEIKIKSIYQ